MNQSWNLVDCPQLLTLQLEGRKKQRVTLGIWIQENSIRSVQFSHYLLLLFATPRTTAHQAFLSITNSWSLLKLMSIELVMPSNHLILCCPLLLLPSIFPSISAAWGILVPQTRTTPVHSAMETQSLSHQTTKEVLNLPSLKKKLFLFGCIGSSLHSGSL